MAGRPSGRTTWITDEQRRQGNEKRSELATSRTERLVEELAKENISTEKFDQARFVCQLVEFSHTRTGDVLVRIRVPYMYRHQASNLKDAYGVMLQCELSPWSQAEEARREAEGDGDN